LGGGAALDDGGEVEDGMEEGAIGIHGWGRAHQVEAGWGRRLRVVGHEGTIGGHIGRRQMWGGGHESRICLTLT
jgi:hypothetical protein